MLHRLALTALLLTALAGAQAQQITAADHNVNGWVSKGTQVRFTMRGTPGGQAMVRLVGVQAETAMRERARGQYEALWTPADGLSSPRTTAVIRLTVNNKTVEMLCPRPLAIDTTIPATAELTPADGATVKGARPEMSALVIDPGGSGVDPTSLQLLVDEEDFTAVATFADGRVRCVPNKDLANGTHNITLVVSDNAGNVVTVKWAFNVGAAGGAAPAVDTGGITVEGDSWIEAGDSIKVTANGPNGAQASFSLIGVQDNIPMQAARNGVYVGTWTPPKGKAITVSGVPLIVRFKAGRTETAIQHPGTLSIDTVGPEVEPWLPVEGGSVNTQTPIFLAYLSDAPGSGVKAETLKWTVDGQTLQADAQEYANGQFMWRPKQPLRVGAHSVRLDIADVAGNVSSKNWAVTITNDGTPIREVIHDARGLLAAEAPVVFHVVAGAKGKTTIDIGDRARFDLPEVQPGVYEGTFKVRMGDQWDNALVTVLFTDAQGKTWTMRSPRGVSTARRPARGNAPPKPDAPAMTKPEITSPTEGATVNSPLTITGKAAAGSQVRLKLDYTTKVLLLNFTGTLLEQVVTADADGNWKLAGVNLDTAATGRGTSFTLTTWMVSDGDKLSDPTTVHFKR